MGETAADVAGPAGATVHVARIFTREEYDRIRDRLNYDPDSDVTPDELAERHVPVRTLTRLLRERGVDNAVHGERSEGSAVGDRIIDLAGELDADMVIVGGRSRSPAGKAVFGSTAQTVMLGAPCPVTFVRTDE